MKKAPFSQEGLNLKIRMINSLNQEDFRKELFNIQYETSDWVINNFELNEDQIEYTRQIPKELMTSIGFETSTCIATGQEIELITPEVYQNPVASKRGIKTKIEGGGTWSWGDTPKIKLKYSIIFTF